MATPSFPPLLPAAHTPGATVGFAALAIYGGFCVARVMELGQLLLPSRYAAVTDVLVQTLGTWLGCVVIVRALEARRADLVRGAQVS